ncbi:hypothetical protein FJT64_015454 [Amphibalanus amphitrite]|uniref:C-type lectin domain-containing protein n=1 Tax=Amphibalanus amphitrite TaxID=1232801 RepID=A0A6A4XGQ3_AMPAM|nr:hypothetical protein FJT64_015454 [Amphibalanus amphitrite]
MTTTLLIPADVTEAVKFSLLARDQHFVKTPLATHPGGSSLLCAIRCLQLEGCSLYETSPEGCLLWGTKPADDELVLSAGRRILAKTLAPPTCSGTFQLVGAVCYHVERFTSSTSVGWPQDTSFCHGLDPSATYATFINQVEYEFLQDLNAAFMLNLQRNSSGVFTMVGRNDPSFWTTKWRSGEPSSGDRVYGYMSSDGLLGTLGETTTLGRNMIVCQTLPN